jgi:glycosyltransferase involved in cell wall biosynthesis
VNILINAVSIKEGGSKVVLLRLLEQFTMLRPEYRWHAAVHPSMVPALPRHPSIIPWAVEAATRSPVHVRAWYEVALPRFVRQRRIDVVFSQTNYLPSRRLSCPTLLLVQHAGHFSDEFRLLASADASSVGRWISNATGRWVRRSVLVASRVTVQTSALAEAIRRDTNLPTERLTVVPHGPGLVTHGQARMRRSPDAEWRIGYVSKFGVQKNFDVLFRAVALLREHHPVELVLTVNERQPAYAKIAARIADLGLSDVVRNLGELATGDIEALYDALDVFAFPSLCESFGFPLVEAMARGLPVVAASVDSTLEIGGNALDYFEPRDEQTLADHVRRLMTDPEAYYGRSRRSLERSRNFSWPRSASQNLSMLEQLAGRASGEAEFESAGQQGIHG